MSTNYYRLKPPVTYLKLEEKPGHDRLRIWINHALAGELVLANQETLQFLGCFCSDDNPLRSYAGTAEQGMVVVIDDSDISDDTQVISSYNELLTVAQVKARHGAKRIECQQNCSRKSATWIREE